MIQIAISPSVNKDSRGLLARRQSWLDLLLILPRGESDMDRITRRTAAAKIEQALGGSTPVVRVDVNMDEARMILRAAGVSG